MNKLFFGSFILLWFSFSCNNEIEDINSKSDFLEAQKLDSSSVFLPTLGTSLERNKNNIYAASLSMAWDEIKTVIGKNLTDFESKKLEEINNSVTHQNVLSKEEYTTNVEINGDIIYAKAYFKKLLPFDYPLTTYKKPIVFKEDSISAFGFIGKSILSQINYYNTDNDFCISLFPSDENHEIILIKTDKKHNSFKDYFDYIFEQKSISENNKKNSWKRELNEEDEVKIPYVDFNFEHNFSDIENTSFSSEKSLYEVKIAYQQTAFVLDENGAKVESVAWVAVEEVVEEIQEVELPPTPKKMIFDSDFIVFLKRKDAKHPYFAIQITNTSLLKK